MFFAKLHFFFIRRLPFLHFLYKRMKKCIKRTIHKPCDWFLLGLFKTNTYICKQKKICDYEKENIDYEFVMLNGYERKRSDLRL